MKNFTAILLAVIILNTAFRDIAAYVAFQLHRDYIAENYCLYRNVPYAMCYGSCFIRNEIEQNHQDNAVLSSNTAINFDWCSCVPPPAKLHLCNLEQRRLELPEWCFRLTLSGYLPTIGHPPEPQGV